MQFHIESVENISYCPTPRQDEDHLSAEVLDDKIEMIKHWAQDLATADIFLRI